LLPSLSSSSLFFINIWKSKQLTSRKFHFH
jgi:hypothetical protein